MTWLIRPWRQEMLLFQTTKPVSLKIAYDPVREKTNNLGFDQVRHKPGCTSTEDG